MVDGWLVLGLGLDSVPNLFPLRRAADITMVQGCQSGASCTEQERTHEKDRSTDTVLPFLPAFLRAACCLIKTADSDRQRGTARKSHPRCLFVYSTR